MPVTLKNVDLAWTRLAAQLDEKGYATTPALLSKAGCRRIAGFYHDEAVRFRARVNMARYNFGRGEYSYFDYPLPQEIQGLRELFYPGLADIANDWQRRLGREACWPDALERLIAQCRAAGQCRPTPLLLKYGAGDYNCLHQDLYGDIRFPLQVIFMLSDPATDFDGGELILVEQRPRLQSRPMVVSLQQGQAAIIPVQERPRRGVRGYHRAPMRHGVSEITRGQRLTLGLIFHDAA